MLSRGTVKLLYTHLFTIGIRLRLELRLQAGEGNVSVNFPTAPPDSATGIGIALGTVPIDSVTELRGFAGSPKLQFENSPAFRPFSCNEKGRFPNRREFRPCTWHRQGG